MNSNFKDFYEILKDNLESYNGEYESFVDFGPDLYQLLSNILNEKSLPSELRIKSCAALGYFVVPFDIIPEQIYGPNGYIDDIFLCAHVIKQIEEEMGIYFLEGLWECDKELKDVLDVCYNQSRIILGDNIDEIMAYVGF